VCIAVEQDMLGQATLILTSSVGTSIITAHNKMLQDKRMKQGLGNAGLPQISNDAYTARVTMMLNSMNLFLYFRLCCCPSTCSLQHRKPWSAQQMMS
jgi:hypothetical protein